MPFTDRYNINPRFGNVAGNLRRANMDVQRIQAEQQQPLGALLGEGGHGAQPAPQSADTESLRESAKRARQQRLGSAYGRAGRREATAYDALAGLQGSLPQSGLAPIRGGTKEGYYRRLGERENYADIGSALAGGGPPQHGGVGYLAKQYNQMEPSQGPFGQFGRRALTGLRGI